MTSSHLISRSPPPPHSPSAPSSQLYGVEPWHFYLSNLSLNFNLALPAFLISPLLLFAGRSFALLPSSPLRAGRTALVISGGLLWLAFYSAVPHKEERFMFVCYPLICLAAAGEGARGDHLTTPA